jgi:hypothetical protein
MGDVGSWDCISVTSNLMNVFSALFALCVALGVVELLELAELVELRGAVTNPGVRLGKAAMFMVLSSSLLLDLACLHQNLHVNIKS